jgi:tetratricopeptide (TPR) repeat protein
LNGATTLKAFGNPEESLFYFEKVEKIYEKNLDENDYLYAGLHNNRALSYVDLGEYEKALVFFEKAIRIMEYRKSFIELAVTYTNMAQMYECWLGDKRKYPNVF